jgi:CrcB protein
VSWQNVLLVALGGAIGSVLRWIVIAVAGARFGPAFPYGTLAVNLAGSFAIGVVFELTAGPAGIISPPVRLFLATGICGGFTTFSTFTLDALALSREGSTPFALVYIVGSVVLGLVAVYLGVVAARVLTPHT